MSKRKGLIFNVVILVVAIVLFTFVYTMFLKDNREPLVVYCAHDSVYSQKILDMFEKKTGIKVVPKFDTEATKSLGLVELIVNEKDNPVCDVFWNNELLGTMYLQKKGVLQPYKGNGYQRIPATLKDPDGMWTGFGARMRVYIVNTDKCKVTEKAVEKRMKSADLSRVAIAKPLYGTTLTHYCCLWRELGGEGLKSLHADRLKRKVNIVNGNGTVKNLVAAGVCDLGWTDTDDFFVAKDAGKPVDMLPIRMADGACISIPNTVAVIKGAKHLDKAKKFVDFLLSEECELALANSKARQIPLGPVDESKLPDDVKQLKKWAGNSTPLHGLSKERAQCVEWLKSLYVK
jgi:iron(III) transport system substrate-binding protein